MIPFEILVSVCVHQSIQFPGIRHFDFYQPGITKWVLISMFIAVPVSWLGMSKWLQNFPYRITLSPDLFILAGFIALSISWITVAYHAWYTAGKNPVDSLRYE